MDTSCLLIVLSLFAFLVMATRKARVYVPAYVAAGLYTGHVRGFVAQLQVVERGHWCGFRCSVCESAHAARDATYEQCRAHRERVGLSLVDIAIIHGMTVQDFGADYEPKLYFEEVTRKLFWSQYLPTPLLAG